MDSDLAEAIAALKAIFEKRFIPANFGKCEASTVKALEQTLPITDRYASFLLNADPLDVETATPPERIRFVPASDLEQEQRVLADGDEDHPPMAGWRESWLVIAHSAMLGDPYFLDTGRGDAEGDCPIYTAMAGTRVEPVLCATSFATFIQILAAAMEVVEGFSSSAVSYTHLTLPMKRIV